MLQFRCYFRHDFTLHLFFFQRFFKKKIVTTLSFYSNARLHTRAKGQVKLVIVFITFFLVLIRRVNYISLKPNFELYTIPKMKKHCASGNMSNQMSYLIDPMRIYY